MRDAFDVEVGQVLQCLAGALPGHGAAQDGAPENRGHFWIDQVRSREFLPAQPLKMGSAPRSSGMRSGQC